MDELATTDSPIHRLHPITKLAATVCYIAVTVSFPKYDFSELLPMVLFPILAFQIAGISMGLCFYKLRGILPIVCAVGLANPFLDRAVFTCIGAVSISCGVISMLTLMMKGIFSLMASFLLVATTSMDALCAALRKLHVPAALTSLLLLTYRYISLMLEEASVMYEAYLLRAPGQNGIHIRAWGSFLGQLLLRSMDRAGELYSSMQLRGFQGEFFYAACPAFRLRDAVTLAGCMLAFLGLRFYDVAGMLGRMIMEGHV